ncbi:hypothetical protein NLX86_24625 [Streptomyces sp. A3M-1-3]|uniref:hypothetical protein n=1 Tax=Streptomyces sp. A3M-1-3 TaxID=2962044 RepID=UPI0020B6979D|nr:hypothetical protein [Streptomyces sp. A3M-1-3]MCP3821160.1 hypothetical protein [Streptomyces sp. A3M-1-3]
MPFTLRRSRRSLLAGAAGAAGAALLAGCSDRATDAAGGKAERASLSADQRTRERAARESALLLARYDATTAAHPALAARLAPLRAEVAAHARAFGAPAPKTAAPPGAPATAPAGSGSAPGTAVGPSGSGAATSGADSAAGHGSDPASGTAAGPSGPASAAGPSGSGSAAGPSGSGSAAGAGTAGAGTAGAGTAGAGTAGAGTAGAGVLAGFGDAVPGEPEQALAALAAAERRTADSRAAALLGAPGELARLLASVAASGAVHAYLLTTGEPK